MKQVIELVVLRHNGVPIMIVPIVDHYTSIQLYVDKSILDEDTIKVLTEHKFVQDNDDSFYLGEQEAKDFQDWDAKLTVKIETVEIEVN